MVDETPRPIGTSLPRALYNDMDRIHSVLVQSRIGRLAELKKMNLAQLGILRILREITSSPVFLQAYREVHHQDFVPTPRLDLEDNLEEILAPVCAKNP